MPVALTHMREMLLPGLMEVAYSSRLLPLQYGFAFQPEIQGVNILTETVVPLPAAIALAAAAVVVKNPEVTRRGLFGLSSSDE